MAANPTHPDATGQRPWTAGWRGALLLSLLALAALSYANAIFHPFLYDDIPLVVRNQAIRSLANVPEFVGVTAEGFDLRTRWTRDVTYALEFAGAGLQPAVFHTTNILLHGITGLLLFLLVSRLTGREDVGWWTAAIFLVHPINTEVVSHVAGRRDVLAALFALAFLTLMQTYDMKGGRWKIGVGLLLLYLATFSKEVGLMAVAAVGLVAIYQAGQNRLSQSGGAAWRAFPAAVQRVFRERWGVLAVLAAASLVMVVSIFAFSSDSPGVSGSASFYETSGSGINLLDRLRLAGMAIRLIILPVGQTVDYSYQALQMTADGLSMSILADLAILLLAVVVTVRGLLKSSWAGFAGVWFAVFYLPHAGLVAWHEIFAERFLYLPAMGLHILAAVTVTRVTDSVRWRRPALAAGVVLLGLLSAGTMLRNQAWGGPKELWSSAVERFPTCARAHKALADHYLDDARTDLALEHYNEAIRILPAYRDAHVGVITVLTAQMHFQDALDHLEVTLNRWPEDSKALNMKGLLFESIGETQEARTTYEEIVRLNPEFAEGYNNLGKYYVEDGDLEGAIRMYKKAIDIDPGLTTALFNLGTVYRHGLEDEETAVSYEERAKEVLRSR